MKIILSVTRTQHKGDTRPLSKYFHNKLVFSNVALKPQEMKAKQEELSVKGYE